MSHYLPFLSHGMVGRRPVLQPVQRCNPTGAQARGFFRQQSASGVLLHAYTHKKSGDAAPSMEASSFQPSVWGDFFINYEPKQLQARARYFYIYVFCMHDTLVKPSLVGRPKSKIVPIPLKTG